MAFLTVAVHGAEEIKELAGRLATARRPLRRELLEALEPVAGRVELNIKAEISQFLPDRGGYAALMARDLDVDPRFRGGANPSVRMRIRARRGGLQRHVPAIERGLLRHPVFGRVEDPWVTQLVESGFVTEPGLEAAQRSRGDIVDAMERVAGKIEG